MIISKDELVKEEILMSAQQLFQQFGLRKTTMEDIARHISKGKSTLYYYYSSKEEIFEAVLQKELHQVFNKTRQEVELAPNGREKLRTYIEVKMQALRKTVNLYQMVRLEMLENPPCYHHLHREYEQRELSLITQILEFGLERGEFHERVGEKLSFIPFIIISSLKAFEFDLFTNNGQTIPFEQKLDAIAELLLNGLEK